MAASPPDELASRDRHILADLARVRLLTGGQLERLHFAALASSNARGSARRRSLGRLVTRGFVTTLPRRVGGERAGSAGLVYALDARAHRERLLWDDAPSADADRPGRTRRPWAIGWLFVRHTVDVAELYVQLREAEHRGELRLLGFDAEPASWHRTAAGTLKPDAYAVVEAGGWERHWWIEVDRGTESLPTVRRKLAAYLQAYRSRDAGPSGVLPRVLVTVPDDRRADGIRGQLRQLLRPGPEAANLIVVVRFQDAAGVLPGERSRPPP